VLFRDSLTPLNKFSWGQVPSHQVTRAAARHDVFDRVALTVIKAVESVVAKMTVDELVTTSEFVRANRTAPVARLSD